MLRSQDLRHAWRSLTSRPAFVAVSVITLGLAIGATTAIFSVVDALVWRPLPYTGAERMVELWTTAERTKISNPGQSLAAFLTLRDQSELFERVEAYDFENTILLGGSEPERITIAPVTPGLLAGLGVKPLRGRLFTEADASTEAEPALIISEALWRSRLGAAADIVGSSMEFDGDRRYTIIGVLPSSFRFPSARTRAWRVLDVAAAGAPSRPDVMAWLQPGVTLDRAADVLAGLDNGLHEAGALSPARRLSLRSHRQMQAFGTPRDGLLVVFGAVALVLLVACANVAGLTLAQAAARQRDVAVAAALGAGRARLVTQFLTESLLVAVAAGGVGTLLAWLMIDGLTALVPTTMTFLNARAIVIDGRVLGFACGVSLLTVLLCGMVPAFSGSRPDLVDSLKTGPRGVSGSRSHGRLRGGIVIVELALAVVLLTGAGLLMRSFVRLHQIDPGFDPAGLLSFTLELPQDRYGSQVARTDFAARLGQALEAVPGVAGATVASSLPPGGEFHFGTEPEAEGEPAQESGRLGIVPYSHVAPDYFATMGIRLQEGRAFTAADPDDVVIVSQATARKYWAQQSPVGRRLRLGAKRPWLTVIGVADDVTQMGLRPNVTATAQIYQPFDDEDETSYYEFAVRTDSLSSQMIADVKARIWALDPRLPLHSLAPVAEQLARTVARERFFLTLMSIFAGLGLLISAVGIYGLMAYSVEVRRREIGIRMALGADQRSVMGSVLRRALLLTLGGVALGVAGAAAAVRVLASLLYETGTSDPVTFGLVVLVLAGVALAAAAIPARRASRLDPLAALRAE